MDRRMSVYKRKLAQTAGNCSQIAEILLLVLYLLPRGAVLGLCPTTRTLTGLMAQRQVLIIHPSDEHGVVSGSMAVGRNAPVDVSQGLGVNHLHDVAVRRTHVGFRCRMRNDQFFDYGTPR